MIRLDEQLELKAWSLMCTAREMTLLYEENASLTSKYVHATSRGHEAIQLAIGLQLLEQDYLSAYYRDDSILLGIGMSPYELMLQLLSKRDDPFSGGRTYYSHPSLNRPGMPKIPHQSSATGMQAIPATGLAMGIRYLDRQGMLPDGKSKPVVVCSIGDAAVTEGEVAEAFQMAALRKLPILFLVQDNGWDISAKAEEIRAMDAFEYAAGFKGLKAARVDGTDFYASFSLISDVLDELRNDGGPWLIHASVPLLNHHTSGVRKEWYRDDLESAAERDPWPRFRTTLQERGHQSGVLQQLESEARQRVLSDFSRAKSAEDPRPEDLFLHAFAPTPITDEQGERTPAGGEQKVMVDCALFAIQELMAKHPECVLYGQDVGARLGGVFREAA
ncbi:MAG: thiamine pyrophosphate-dependent dehydrogenase E1 component subunit alpha, partial [Bacteroidota bacterium]